MKRLRLFLLLSVLMTVSGMVFATDYTQDIAGYVLKVKTESPYPFTTKEGHIWQCKIRVMVCESDGDCYIYKAYHLHGSDTEWTCGQNVGRLGLQPGDFVVATVVKKKPDNLRGEIKSLTVITVR